MNSVFTCNAVPHKTNRTVLEMWILLLYFYSTLSWIKEIIKTNINIKSEMRSFKSNENIHKKEMHWLVKLFVDVHKIIEVSYSKILTF